MGSAVIGIVVSAVAGAVVAAAATLGVVSVVTATPSPTDQATLVQYADQ